MRLACGAGRVTEPVPVGDLVRGAGRGAGPVGRGPEPGPAAGPGPVHRGGAAGAARWGGFRPCLRIIRAVFAALADPAGVTAHRPGALERAHLALGD